MRGLVGWGSRPGPGRFSYPDDGDNSPSRALTPPKDGLFGLPEVGPRFGYSACEKRGK